MNVAQKIKDNILTILITLVWVTIIIMLYPDVPFYVILLAIASIFVASISDHRHKLNFKDKQKEEK